MFPSDLEVQIAIATDIACVSPNTFPAVAGILSILISLAAEEQKSDLWQKVRVKMQRLPYNGYIEIWLQRIVKASSPEFEFDSQEEICRIVGGEACDLWDNSWISSRAIQSALSVSIISQNSDDNDIEETISNAENEEVAAQHGSDSTEESLQDILDTSRIVSTTALEEVDEVLMKLFPRRKSRSLGEVSMSTEKIDKGKSYLEIAWQSQQPLNRIPSLNF